MGDENGYWPAVPKRIIKAFYKARRKIARVKMDCAFEDNKCAATKGWVDHYYPSTWKGAGCCCGDCGTSRGYYKYYEKRLMSKAHVRYLEEAKDPMTGYWIKEQGCKLPRMLRSSTCLSYYCSHVKVSDKIKSILKENDRRVWEFFKGLDWVYTGPRTPKQISDEINRKSNPG